ncbi:MAG TPA: hypothetical protein EYG03_27105 [Planctomycetes bacterium]|nr:hypothetical protein [Fuerstiella sp.]HIK95632.1 hypothetical protein [Planctomycetota bacterium]
MNETNTQTDDHVTQANATPPETRRRNRLTRGLVAMATIAFVTIGIEPGFAGKLGDHGRVTVRSAGPAC